MPDLCERALKTVPSSREEGIFSFEEQELITMQKKSIYVAYTGGTIGMQRSENGYIPVSGHLQRQLALMPEFHRPEMPDFTIHEYEPLMDSSDMTPEDWQHIADDIRAHYDEYDGFVILHGTDTMAFTASALSFMLEHLGKPVIVTGSQIPLAELRSDGQINLLNALYVAANYPINEVALFFNNRLYRGNRTTKAHADGFDAFASPNLAPLLEAGIHIRRLGTPPAPQGIGELIVHPITPQPIGVVTIYPGISADVVRNSAGESVDSALLWRRQRPAKWRVHSGSGGSQSARDRGHQPDPVHVRQGQYGRVCHR